MGAADTAGQDDDVEASENASSGGAADTEMTDVAVKANGSLFELPGGAVRLAVGAETYYQTFANTDGAVGFDNLTLAPVPEPGTYALMLAGLGAVGFIARRRTAR